MRARAGLHTGQVVVLGDRDDRRRRVVPGRTLDLATAMEERAPAGGVVLSEVTRGLVSEWFELRELAAESPATTAWEVVAVVDPQGWPASATPVQCVGRSAELRLLQEGLRSVLDGQGRAFVRLGEAGVGKTRLVRALYDERPVTDTLWLRVQGLPARRHQPLVIVPPLLGEVAERRAVVVVVEDLQWLDPASHELVSELVELAAFAPILLLVTCREHVQPTWGRRAAVTRLPLARLDREPSTALLEHLTAIGEAPDVVPPATRAALLERAEGLPRGPPAALGLAVHESDREFWTVQIDRIRASEPPTEISWDPVQATVAPCSKGPPRR